MASRRKLGPRTKADRRCLLCNEVEGLMERAGHQSIRATTRCSRGSTVLAKEVVPCLPSRLFLTSAPMKGVRTMCRVRWSFDRLLGATVTTRPSARIGSSWRSAVPARLVPCRSRLPLRRESATGCYVGVPALNNTRPAKRPVRAALRSSLSGLARRSPKVVLRPGCLRASLMVQLGCGCRSSRRHLGVVAGSRGFHWLLS